MHRCYTRDELLDFALGRLDRAAVESMAEQIEQCATCQAGLAELDQAEDSVLGEIRRLGRAAAIEPPAKIDAYELLEQIGQGGMASVWRAKHELLDKLFALKLLDLRGPLSEDAADRFRREMQAAGRMQHPNLVPATDAGTDEGYWFLVMELLDGCNLKELVECCGPLSPEDACRLAVGAARGLAHAHEHGLVHRDVKPSNIQFTAAGEVKLLDLGLARVLDQIEGPTPKQQWLGTAAYLAPEQAERPETVDQRADLYALGGTLYFLLTGQRPYEQVGAGFLEQADAHREQPPPDIEQQREGLPAELIELLRQLLSKDPRDRPESAAQVAEVLERLAGPERTLAELIERAKASAPKPVLVPWVGILVALLTLLGGGLAWMLLLSGPARDRDGAEVVNSLGMTLRRIPAGRLVMGSPESDVDAAEDEQPPHEVTISRPFYLGVHEVTVGQFRAFVAASGYTTRAERHGDGWMASRASSTGYQGPDVTWRSPGFPQTDDHPVCCVAREDAEAFCRWLSEQEGATYRLPTEAEWEYACRAGTSSIRYCEEQALDEHQWGLLNSEMRTHPVGQKQPNPWGLLEMYGNVREHCLDDYDPDFYRDGPRVDPVAKTDSQHVSGRGSSFMDLAPFIRSAKRMYLPRSRSQNNTGFRVLRER